MGFFALHSVDPDSAFELSKTAFRQNGQMDKKIFKNSLCNTLALIWSIEPLPNVHDNSAKDREK